MPRPGGNPNLSEYQFQKKYNWSGPCEQRLVVRIPVSMQEAIDQTGMTKEQIREAIAVKIKELNPELFNSLFEEE